MGSGTKGEATRQHIEKVAIEEFSAHGFQKTSYEMLAKASGVKRANIQYHFPQKEDLFLACVRRVAMENHAAVAERMPIDLGAREKLELHFRANLAWFLANRPRAQIILGFYYLACVDERFSKACRAVFHTGATRILEYLLLGVRTREFRAELASLESVAETLHDALVGAVLRSVTLTEAGAEEAEVARAEEKWMRLFDSLLGAASAA